MKASIMGSFLTIVGSLAAFSFELEEGFPSLEEELLIDEEDPFCCIEDDDPCEEYPYCVAPHRICISHIEGKGIGYKTGYTSLGLFLGFGELLHFSVNRCEPFIDVRAHVLNNGHFAANVGGGIRRINYCESIWGINAYYDWRRGKYGSFQQAGVGCEILREHLGVRANVYLPVGKRVQSSKDEVFSDYEGGYVITCKIQETARTGADSEFGFFTGSFCDGCSLYFGVGPYFYKSHDKDIVGGMGRAILQISDYIGLEGRLFYDTVDKGIAQIKIALVYPFARRQRSQILRRSEGCYCEDVTQFKELAIQPVLRNEMIFLDKHLHCSIQ